MLPDLYRMGVPHTATGVSGRAMVDLDVWDIDVDETVLGSHHSAQPCSVAVGGGRRWVEFDTGTVGSVVLRFGLARVLTPGNGVGSGEELEVPQTALAACTAVTSSPEPVPGRGRADG